MKQSSKQSSTNNKVVFFGNERVATGLTTRTPLLLALIKAGYEVEAVVASHDDARSRNQRQLEIQQTAEDHRIPLHLPSSPQELKEVCSHFTSDIAVLLAYGRIIPQDVIDLFPNGIINIHPSLLPKHRGPTPIESVLLQGERETGVSIMRLTAEMDAGPVFTQTHCVLAGTESKQDMANILVQQGIEALLDVLPNIISGKLSGTDQNHSEATYDKRIDKKDGIIDWRKPAAQIEREVRAYALWPRSRTKLAGIDVVITDAHILPNESKAESPGTPIIEGKNNCLAIACGDGNYLCIERLIPAGKREMRINAFLAGYGSRIGV